MNFKLIFDTVAHLKAEQIAYQIRYRMAKPKFKAAKCPDGTGGTSFGGFIPKWKCLDGNSFSFLNIADEFRGWDFTGHGMLWAYNLNYMDWLLQEDMDTETGSQRQKPYG